MKIQIPSTAELQKKSAALLFRAFNSNKEEKRIEKLRSENHLEHEWVMIHRNMAIGYIAFTPHADAGLTITSLAVHPDFQNQGIGTELIQFSQRQKSIKDQEIFVCSLPKYFKKFGFQSCPKCN